MSPVTWSCSACESDLSVSWVSRELSDFSDRLFLQERCAAASFKSVYRSRRHNAKGILRICCVLVP